MLELWWQQNVQLYQQIFFADYSIKKMRKNNEKDSFIGVFYHVQILLSCLGNISKLLNNTPQYCNYLAVDFKHIPNILDRNMRNINEHIDERINNSESIGLSGSDMSLTYADIEEEDMLCPQRIVNMVQEELKFKDRRQGVITVKIKDLENELHYLSSLEPMKYIFERYKGYDKIY